MEKAVIVGAGLAGLMSAVVLAPVFDRVVLIDPDRMPEGPEPRKAAPQGHHVHALLQSGEQVLGKLFPGFSDELVALGAHRFRVRSQWRMWGGTAWMPPDDIGLTMMSQTRPLVEHLVRQRSMALENVDLVAGRVDGLSLGADGALDGVRMDGQVIAADLVVDATGRGARPEKWLEDIGATPPPIDLCAPLLTYTSTFFSRGLKEGPDFGGWLMFASAPETRGAVAIPVEGGRWMVTAIDRFGAAAPQDEDGFRTFLAGLPDDRFTTLLAGERPVAPFERYRVPQVYLRRFDEVADKLPGNYLPVGDVIATFNPIYAQGMSVAALQVDALRQAARDVARDVAGGTAWRTDFLPRYIGRAMEVARWAWTLGQAGEAAYEQVKGDFSPEVIETSRTMGRLGAALPEHPELAGPLGQAIHLFLSPQGLKRAVDAVLGPE